MEPLMNDVQIKNLFKTAIIEVMEERRDIFREAIEDIAFSRAIEEGLSSGIVSREEIFSLLESAA